MAGRNCADIVFCIDASGSMQPAIDAVRDNVNRLLEGLTSGSEQGYSWDLRFDFLAFHASRQGVVFHMSCRGNAVDDIYGASKPESFFTRDVNEFKSRLSSVPVEGEEIQLMALDIALDFPWRPSSACHRVVVLLTDEAVETGLMPDEQKSKISDLVQKLQAKRIKLFIIAPESEGFYQLAEADRCEYTDLETDGVDGLRNVDFSKMLETIGKSVSVSQTYDGGDNTPRPLFGQRDWTDHRGSVSWGSDH